jgi:NAD(P)-dependent dehydrogenase (short-subunit alcohol dehydrogenase family)
VLDMDRPRDGHCPGWRAGYAVVATARRPEAIAGLGVALALPLDVTDDASITSAVNETPERFGRIDGLVNNAGFAVRGAVEEVGLDGVQAMFGVNVLGVIRMVHAVAPVMRRQSAGRMVTIGSIGGLLANPANGTSAATKHAVEALSDAMRVELGMLGIDVVLVEPGNIRTSFGETADRASASILDRPDSPTRRSTPGMRRPLRGCGPTRRAPRSSPRSSSTRLPPAGPALDIASACRWGRGSCWPSRRAAGTPCCDGCIASGSNPRGTAETAAVPSAMLQTRWLSGPTGALRPAPRGTMPL